VDPDLPDLRRRRPLVVLGSVAAAAATVATALTWPSLAWAIGAGVTVVIALTAVFVLIRSWPRAGRTQPDRDRASEAEVSRELLDQLPLGVLAFDRDTRRCTYRNRLGARWGASSAAGSNAVGPWDPGHLAEVATKLQTGGFTEPLPRGTRSASPPAEVRWEAIGGRLLATIRGLSDEEEQRMVLDELHLDAVAEGGDAPQQVSIETLCWEVAESLAGDRRPLGVEVETPDAVVFGDPELLRAAISQVVARSTSGGDDSAPVTLRVTTEQRSVLVQVDEPDDPAASTPQGRDELGLARRLAAVHGGELQIHHLGAVRRTQLDLPRALPQEL
jgi:hypothetical protein